MIVVVGQPFYRETESDGSAAGLAARIALAAASHGGTVQLVGKVGEDAAGDAVVLALATGRVGHVALLRDAGLSTPRLRGRNDEAFEAPVVLPDDVTTGDSGPAGDGAPLPALDADDVDLALRYLSEFGVVVLAEALDPEVVAATVNGAVRVGAALIMLLAPGVDAPNGLSSNSILFEAPDADPDGVFAEMVGSFAAALDDGDEPAEAFRSAVAVGGWTASSEDATG